MAKKVATKKKSSKTAGKSTTKKTTARKKTAGKTTKKKTKATKTKTAKKKTSKKKAATKKTAVKKTAVKKKTAKKKAAKKSPAKKKAAAVKTLPKSAPAQTGAVSDDGYFWVPADKGYSLALKGKKLHAKNAKGKKLASVPPAIKKTELAQQLTGLRDWLVQHRQECSDNVETWMLRSLPVPRDVLSAVWVDESWQSVLKNVVVAPLSKDGFDQDSAGFLRGADPKKGIGIVDLDGETQWIKTQTVAIPHPILLNELDDFRELATELDLKQETDQLFRETWKYDSKTDKEPNSVSRFSGGTFQMLSHANSAARGRGYRTRGGSAICTVWEAGQPVEARYWIGDGDPEYETWTGDLSFVDHLEKPLPLAKVGPVAFSEGTRMAAAIYSKRFIEKEQEDS